MYNQSPVVIPEFFYREISIDFDPKNYLVYATTTFEVVTKDQQIFMQWRSIFSFINLLQ